MIRFYVDIYVKGQKYTMMDTTNADFASAVKILLTRLIDLGLLKVDSVEVHI